MKFRVVTGIATVAVLTVFLMASVALAAPIVTTTTSSTNGQKQANNDIIRTTSTMAVTTITKRIAAVASPSGIRKQKQTASRDGNGNISFAMNAKDMGLASGDNANNFGVWGMQTYTRFSSSQSGAKYSADEYETFLGADVRPFDDLLVGLALGYGTLDLDKDNWSNGDDGSLKTDYQWTIMPYAAYNITDSTILDAAFGATFARYKDDDGTDTGHYDSTTTLGSLGLSQYYDIDAWDFSARVGYMYVNGNLDSYSRGGVNITNDDSYLGQLSLEGKVGYEFDCGATPYVAMRYYYDVQTSSTPVGSDYDEFEGALGLDWALSDSLSLNLEGSASMDRTDYEAYHGQVYLRWEF